MKADSKSPLPSPGDDGSTGLPGGMRVRKSDAIICALGSLDELNAALGLLKVQMHGEEEVALLESIQRDLFNIGGELATGTAQLSADSLATLDHEIKQLDTSLPPLSGFILLGGNEAAARAHWARTVCRRTERDLVRIRDMHQERVSPTALATLNRVSKWLFALGRSLDS